MNSRNNEQPPPEIPGKCNALKSGGRGRCRLPAGARTGHLGFGRCYRHGGSTPTGIKGAQTIMAKQAVATYGLPISIAPQEALLQEVWRTAGVVQYLEGEIRELEPDEVVWGQSEEIIEALELDGHTGQANLKRKKISAIPHALIRLYQIERKHLVEVCKTAIACGLAERQVRLSEEYGRLIARVVMGVLGDLGVDVTSANAREAVRRHLTLVASTKDESAS